MGTFTSIQKVLETLGIWNFTLHSLAILALVSFGALAVVYIFGRFLDIAKTDRSKNAIALVTMFFLSFLVVGFIDFKDIMLTFKLTSIAMIVDYGFLVLFHYLFSILFYSVFCFKFFDNCKKILEKLIKPKK
jgi:hypothetical protein